MNVNKTDYPFHYGSMTKIELAGLYFPDRDAVAARRKLNYWVSHHKTLSAELAETGYTPRNVLLTPAQVDLIIRHLGEP